MTRNAPPLAHGSKIGLVAAEIVDDGDIPRLRRRDQYLLDIGEEAFPVDRATEHARRIDAVEEQCTDGQCTPSPARGLADKALAALALIMERIASNPHITIRGLLAELAERGTRFSYGTVRNHLHRNGQSFKKAYVGIK